MRRLNSVAWWTLILATWCLLSAALIPSFVRGDEPTAKWEPTERQILLHEECQRHRINQGRSRQTIDEELCRLCQQWAERMASRGAMFHGGGENIIAYGTNSAPATMQMWIGSGGHNAHLLSRTTKAGWGHAVSRAGTHYWAGAFRGAVATATATVSHESSSGRVGLLRRVFGRR